MVSALVIAGSFNYAAPATTLSDENIIVLNDLEETNRAAEPARRQLATARGPRTRSFTDLIPASAASGRHGACVFRSL